MPVLRRGHHALPDRRGGPSGRGDRSTPTSRRSRDPSSTPSGRRARRRARGRARRRPVRLGRARRHRGRLLGRAEAARAPRPRAPGRRRVRRHPLGRADLPRPDRAPRRLDARSGAPAAVHRAARAAGSPPGVGWRQDERDVDPARAAAVDEASTLVDNLLGRADIPQAARDRILERRRGQPAVRRGDARDADRRRAASIGGRRVASGRGPRGRDGAAHDPSAPRRAIRSARRRGARRDRAWCRRGQGVPLRRGRDPQPTDRPAPGSVAAARAGAQGADPSGPSRSSPARTPSGSATC